MAHHTPMSLEPHSISTKVPVPIKNISTPYERMDGNQYPTNTTSPRGASPENLSSRSSFSSVRENDLDIQTFTSTKVSSYSRTHLEDAVDDTLPREMATQTEFIAPITQPQSRLHGCWFPAVAADSFQGWKQIGVKGRQASRSFGDLQSLRLVWSNPSTPIQIKKSEPVPGISLLERLPPELQGPIIELLIVDVPPNGITARNVDLMSMLLTSRTMHAATLNALYKNITIPHSRIFRKFLTHVLANQELGTLVRRLDFSHFNPMTAFTTAAERATTRNLTSETLLQCLELTPFLKEFLAQEHVDTDIDGPVLRKLFLGLERLEAVDFTGITSTSFNDAMSSLEMSHWPENLSISRLSFHKCIKLPSAVFEALLPRLPKLTHLDVSGTRITNEALRSISHKAHITHLNLSKCRLLTAENVIDFLASHKSVKELVYLSLATDARSHQLLDVDDVAKLLYVLPSTLRSLSLKGSKMDSLHIDSLRPLTKHLEELAVGRRLQIKDIDRLFRPDENEDLDKQLEWVPHSLKYLDLSDYTPAELNLSELFGNSISIMKKYSAPLEVVEVTDELYNRLLKSPVVEKTGWTVSEFGSRAWLVRKQSPEDGQRDPGFRSWKMGASFWGMRKVPMAIAEVGGMYGSYMFKRKL